MAYKADGKPIPSVLGGPFKLIYDPSFNVLPPAYCWYVKTIVLGKIKKNSLEKVNKLQGKSFTLNNDITGKKNIGMIAQEVLEVVPELVKLGENGYYSINYANTVALLIEAIKEQQKQIDELKKKIDN